MIISVTEVVNTYSQQEDDMITMAEIARLTGVSQPTVSRVLNGNKAVNPNNGKRQRYIIIDKIA